MISDDRSRYGSCDDAFLYVGNNIASIDFPPTEQNEIAASTQRKHAHFSSATK